MKHNQQMPLDSDVQWIDLDHKHLRARIIKEKKLITIKKEDNS